MENYIVTRELPKTGIAANNKSVNNFQIGVDAPIRKIAFVLGLFIIMFGLPSFLLNNWESLANGEIPGAFTNASRTGVEVTEANRLDTAPGIGRVAGASINTEANSDSILGVPLTTVLISVGAIFLILPMAVLFLGKQNRQAPIFDGYH